MRLHTVRRILDVQRQLQRAAEWELHELRQQESELRTAQQEVIGALNDEGSLHGQFVHAMARQLARLATRSHALAEASERQAEVVLERTGRLKQAERLERSLEREDERTREKNGLSDLADLIAGHPGASLP